MKTKIRVLVPVLCAVPALAQTFPVVVPGGLANTEGNSSMTEPLNSPSFRMQMVFGASQFGFLGSGTGRIDMIDFRVDGGALGGAAYSFSGSVVQLSTTARGPDSLSPVFGENIGSDVKTLWAGGNAFGNLYFPGQSPQPFTQTHYTGYLYSPSMGNLLLDIVAGGGQTVFSGGLDAQAVNGDSVSRVYANSEFATFGTADTFALVTRFSVTIVPEPTVWLILVVGLASLGMFRRR